MSRRTAGGSRRRASNARRSRPRLRPPPASNRGDASERDIRIPGKIQQAREVEKTRRFIVATKFVAKDERDWQPAPAPDTSSLTTLKTAAKTCTACHLYKRATQTVFGEGPKGATLMLLGEQPGDQEEVAGKPFVGPAGGILNRAPEETGMHRTTVTIATTVNHFK